MAGSKKSGEKFLSPSYFQVSRPKVSPKKKDLASVKLHPPAEYNVAKEKEESNARAAAEINKLQNENKQLREELETSKEQELRLEAEIRKNRLLVQKERVDDALDLKRMAELQEENLALQSEVRKLSSLTAKLRTDLREMKSILGTDLERAEEQLEKANVLIKELKAELKQKEEIFEREMGTLEKRSKKQAAVIKNLKAEVKNVEEQVKIDRKGFEDVISKNHYDKYEQVKALEKRLGVCEANYLQELQEMRNEISSREQIQTEMKENLSVKEEELKNLRDELKAKEEESTTMINEHQEKLKINQLHFEKSIAELNNKIEKQMFSHQNEVENLTVMLQKKEDELRAQSSIVDQLRTYIGENLPNTQIEKLQRENEEERQNMMGLLQENENLRSTAELFNVRLTSLNEILSIQETELLRFHTKCTKESRGQEEDLLTKWREKVFALLVQLKSQAIIHEKEDRNGRAQVQHLMKELEESQKEAALLTHTLVDKKAEHQIEINRNIAVERQLEKSHQSEIRLKSLLADFQMSVYGLQEVAQATENFVKQISSKMDEAFKKLAVFSQRISFASGRVKFLEGLITHREAQLRNPETLANKATDNLQSASSEEGDISESEPGLPYQQLASEVKQLTKERDHLLAQARKDSETLEKREMAVKAQFEEQLQESHKRITQLESLLKDERERGAVLSQKLQMTEADLSERLESIEALKTEMAKHKDKAEKHLDKVLQAEQARFTEEFAKLERQFNDVRREHTKAVVALRQAERQVEREKEKSAEQLSLQQKEYEMKLEKCQSQARQLEKERNMLMATVRQEGFKDPRLRPKEFSAGGRDDEKENRDHTHPVERGPTKTSRGKGKQQKAEKSVQSNAKIPSSLTQDHSAQASQTTVGENGEELNLIEMTSVLKDLHSLSTALLMMDKESGEDSQQSL